MPKAKNGPRRPGTRKVIGAQMSDYRGLDCGRIRKHLFRAVDRIEADRALLLAAAKLGDMGALILLKEQWGVRLPKIEGRMKYTLPWMNERG